MLTSPLISPPDRGAPAGAAGAWPALLTDLQALDAQLNRAVEQVRQAIAPAADPTVRGLLIEEGDVDRWLGNLESPAGRRSAGEDFVFPGQPGGRLAHLGDLFGLGAFERAALLTVLAPEIDLVYANLYAYVQDDVTRKYATVDLVLALWCAGLAERMAARMQLGPEAPLRRHLLLSVDESSGSAATSLLSRPLVLDSRIASYLLGSDRPDPALAGAVRVLSQPQALVPGPAAPLPDEVATRLEYQVRRTLAIPPPAASDGPPPLGGVVVWMRGPEAQGKRATAEGLAAALGRPLLVVDCAALAAIGGDLNKAIYRALREARLQGGLVFWTGADALAPKREETMLELGPGLARLLADWPGCALFDINTAAVPHLTGGPAVIDLEF